MAQINNLTSYPTATPVANSIVIGSIASGGATNNFLMSDIATYVMGANTLTLQDVCDNGTATTTGVTVGGTTTLNGALVANSTADIAGNTTIGGSLNVSQGSTFQLGVTIDNAGLAVNGSGGIIVGSTSGITSFGPISGTILNSTGGLLVSGTSLLGDIDAGGVADIADTLTLSKATGTGLQVDANVNIDGDANINGDLTVGRVGSQTGDPFTIYTANNLAATVNTFARFVFEYGISASSGVSTLNGLVLTDTAPASASASGMAGQIAVDTDYIYVCTATNTWKRVAVATW